MNSPKICSQDEVERFIARMSNLLHNPNKLSIIKKTANKEDKTMAFQTKYNLKDRDVLDNLLQLDSTNYSYTDNDDDPEKEGEVWIFGQILMSPLVKPDVHIYIKLKLLQNVVCLSFHEAEFKLQYPYNVVIKEK